MSGRGARKPQSSDGMPYSIGCHRVIITTWVLQKATDRETYDAYTKYLSCIMIQTDNTGEIECIVIMRLCYLSLNYAMLVLNHRNVTDIQKLDGFYYMICDKKVILATNML